MLATRITTAVMAAVLLVGSLFVLAGTASADDVSECEDDFQNAGDYAYIYSACVEDTQSGDQSDCSDGWYTGQTSASGDALIVIFDPILQAVLIDAEAGGEETCDGSGVSASASILTINDAGIDQVATSASWDDDGIQVDGRYWSTTTGEYTPFTVSWGPSGDDCTTLLEVDGDTVAEEDCPADGPPAAPNPGWGGLTPDT